MEHIAYFMVGNVDDAIYCDVNCGLNSATITSECMLITYSADHERYTWLWFALRSCGYIFLGICIVITDIHGSCLTRTGQSHDCS